MDKIIPLQVNDGLPDYPVKEGFTDIEKKLRDCSALALEAPTGVITSYSIHYTKLYEIRSIRLNIS